MEEECLMHVSIAFPAAELRISLYTTVLVLSRYQAEQLCVNSAHFLGLNDVKAVGCMGDVRGQRGKWVGGLLSENTTRGEKRRG